MCCVFVVRGARAYAVRCAGVWCAVRRRVGVGARMRVWARVGVCACSCGRGFGCGFFIFIFFLHFFWEGDFCILVIIFEVLVF